MKRIDRIDERIIEAYQKNARISNRDLAAHVDMSPSTTYDRTRRLEEIGVFRGFHADVDPAAMGVRLQAMISVRLTKHDPLGVRYFRAHILSVPEVREAFHMAGAEDFLLHVVVRDSEHLRTLVLDQVIARPEVDHVETNLIFEHRRNPVLPSLWSDDD